MKTVHFTVNGIEREIQAEPGERLLDVLRNTLHLTGTKEGCGIGECGACTVILDGQAVNACLVPAASLEGRQVTTVEGLMKNEKLHPLQEAFMRHNAIQCGFCTPGLLMSAKALLDENPHPGREEIAEAVSGNLCRCTGYEQVIAAIQDAAGSAENPEAAGGSADSREAAAGDAKKLAAVTGRVEKEV